MVLIREDEESLLRLFALFSVFCRFPSLPSRRESAVCVSWGGAISALGKEVCELINIEGKFCIKQVSDLVPYERNPRNNKRAIDAVAECIKRFGSVSYTI